MVKSQDQPVSTQERILNAARDVFYLKGLDGARMQEIADRAGINKALLHYYFRNKESLFQAVFNQAVAELAPAITEVFLSERPLLEKIRGFFDLHIGFIQNNPMLPHFIISELTRNPEMIWNGFKSFLPQELFDRFSEDVSRSIKSGEIKPIDPIDLIINILSLSVFPFLAKPLLSRLFPLDENAFDPFMENRKSAVSNFVINALK